MPAPEGNKFNRKWDTPEELKADIDAWLDECEEKKNPLTITGLAIALDTNRQTLLNYENNLGEDFDALIKKAKLMCENFAEQYLYSGKNVAGAIFNLKNNYGWKEEYKIDDEGAKKQIDELRRDLRDFISDAKTEPTNNTAEGEGGVS